MNNINDAFFRGHYKEVWRQTIPHGLTEAECDFIEDICQLKKGNKVLDLMAGYGRHSLELGKRGYDMTAIDIEPDYVSEINETAKVAGINVKGITGSIEDSLPEENFDAVICMGNSFAFFPEEKLAAILETIASRLKKGGHFIINNWTIAEIAIRHFKEKEWHELPGFRYLISNQYKMDPARIESTHIITSKDGHSEEIKGVDYIFTINEMKRLLKAAGFSLEQVYSTPRKKIFTLGDGRAYIVATRL